MTTAMEMGEKEYCSDCRRRTTTVLDYATGDAVCSDCGLVLEAHMVDPSHEWRTFADADPDGPDPRRVGARVDLLLDEAAPAPTFISRSKPNCNGFGSSAAADRRTTRLHDPNKGLVDAFATISAIGDRLGLLTTIKDMAKEIYKEVKDQKKVGGQNLGALSAACLFVACRMNHCPRTIKEVFSATHGATKTQIGRAISIVEAEVSKMGSSVTSAADYMRRFCSFLGLSNDAVKAAQEAVKNMENIDIRRSPISVAAALIYMIMQLSGNKKTIKDVSFVTGASESTIKKTYKDLYPYAAQLVPTSFAGPAELRNLPPVP